MNVKVGDVVRATIDDVMWGDFCSGDEGVVNEIHRHAEGGVAAVFVNWTGRRYPDDPQRELGRLDLLFVGEFEVIS